VNPVRLIVELNPTGDSQIAGAVTPERSDPVPFSGWLELLRVLESMLEPPSTLAR
jgi:hypothetical protein